MSSLYSKFIKETLNWNCLEDENSFVSYEIQEYNNKKCLKIYEMFIEQQSRSKDKSKQLLETLKDIAIENKCTIFSAQISQNASEFIKQRSAHICRLFGMEKTYEDTTVIIYSRSL